jgi:hypothetical protein
VACRALLVSNAFERVPQCLTPSLLMRPAVELATWPVDLGCDPAQWDFGARPGVSGTGGILDQRRVGIPTERLADPLDHSHMDQHIDRVTLAVPSGPACNVDRLKRGNSESQPPSDGALRSAQERSSPD